MTPASKLAKDLNGREYPLRLSEDELTFAQANKLVIVRGHSDDVGVLEGAISDEFYDKTRIARVGVPTSACDEGSDCPYFQKHLETLPNWIDLSYCQNGWDTAFAHGWDFRANFPASRFEILEDGELFQKAMIFSLDDLQ